MKVKYILLILLVSLLSACQQTVPTNTPTGTDITPKITAATEQAPAEKVPHFESYFEESPCSFAVPENYIEGQTLRCGYVVVPEDHQNPGGKKIKLAAAVFKAQNPNPHPDPLIFLSGGPGEKTIAYVAPLAEHLAGFNIDRDLVFFDQRGVGSSLPALECPEFVDSLFEILDDPDPTSAQQTTFKAVIACKDRLVEEGHNLAAYTTTQNAADVESIREALGYEQINLFGGSYGSLLAQAVMRDHPHAIRSVIIDSTVPMEKSLLIDIPTTSVSATMHLMSSCAADQACSSAYPDLEKVLFDIIAAHNNEPVPISLVNPLDGSPHQALLTGDMIFGNLVFFLYQTPVIPTLPKAISDVAEGDYNLMVQLSSRRLAAFDAVSRGMSFSVLCTDDLIGRTPEDYLKVRAGIPPQLAGRIDPETVIDYGFFEICKNWPVNQGDPTVREPVVSDIPTLILGGEFDPVTPPEYGEMVAEHLKNSYCYEYPGVGHSVTIANDCARQMTTEFLENPYAVPDDSCRKSLAIEFVLPIDLDKLTLLPVDIKEFGIQALVPEGWTQVKPEYYVSPDTTIELVIKENSSESHKEFLDTWGASQAISEINRNDLLWTVYEASLPDYNITGYIATAPSENGFFMILMITSGAQQESLFENLMVPIIDGFQYGAAP